MTEKQGNSQMYSEYKTTVSGWQLGGFLFVNRPAVIPENNNDFYSDIQIIMLTASWIPRNTF